MGRSCKAYGGVKRSRQNFDGKISRKGRSIHRWEDNIKMNLLEVVCGSVDWIELAPNRNRWQAIVNAVINFWIPWNARNFLTSCKPGSLSWRILLLGISKYLCKLTKKYVNCCTIHVLESHSVETFLYYSCSVFSHNQCICNTDRYMSHCIWIRSHRITYHGGGCFFSTFRTELKQLLSFARNRSLLYCFNITIM
jgi:hypothetical protein